MWLLPLAPAHKTGAVLGQVIEELTGKNQRTPLPCTLITMTTTINDHKSIPYITTDTGYNRVFKHSSTLLGEGLCPCEVSVGSLSARLELNWDVACSGVEELMQDQCAGGQTWESKLCNIACRQYCLFLLPLVLQPFWKRNYWENNLQALWNIFLHLR